MPCVFNAANEHCANAFLEGGCGFLQIADVVEQVMLRHTKEKATLESILSQDRWARETADSILKSG